MTDYKIKSNDKTAAFEQDILKENPLKLSYLMRLFGDVFSSAKVMCSVFLGATHSGEHFVANNRLYLDEIFRCRPRIRRNRQSANRPNCGTYWACRAVLANQLCHRYANPLILRHLT